MAQIQPIDVKVTIKSLKETNCKCPRCRHESLCWGSFGHTKQEIIDDKTGKLAREKLCQRCIDVILSEYPDHISVQYIKLYQEKEKEHFLKTGEYIDSFDKVILWD